MGMNRFGEKPMNKYHVYLYITLRNLLRALRLNHLARSLIRYMPKRIRSWYSLSKVYTRQQELISTHELEPQLRKALSYLTKQQSPEALGDYLEFGVCHGTSLACMHHVLTDLGYDHVRLFGFDSFEGLPETADRDDDGQWYSGQFNSDYQWTQSRLTADGVDWTRTHLFKGWFSETLTEDIIEEYQIEKASIVMIDCDMYLSAKEALDFCAPLIQDQAIILFDDWNTGNLAQKNMGEKRAFDEFLEENTQFTAKEFGMYTFEGIPNAKIFLVTNTKYLVDEDNHSTPCALPGRS